MLGEILGTVSEATFFVSKDGDDAWSGRLATPNAEKTDGPFATLAKAKDAVRAMKTQQPLSAPVTASSIPSQYKTTRFI